MITVRGCGPPWGGGFGPLGLSCLSPAQGIVVRFRFPQTAPAGNGGPTCGRPHRRGGRGHGEGRAWWVTKTGGTSGWLGCRAFGVEELRAEPAGQGGEVMRVTAALKSLSYNNQSGLRASAGGGSARCGSCLAALPARKPCGIKAFRHKNS